MADLYTRVKTRVGDSPQRLGAYANLSVDSVDGEEEEDQAAQEELKANTGQHKGFHHSTPIADDMLYFLRCIGTTNKINSFTKRATRCGFPRRFGRTSAKAHEVTSTTRYEFIIC